MLLLVVANVVAGRVAVCLADVGGGVCWRRCCLLLMRQCLFALGVL